MFYSKKNETAVRSGRSDTIGTILGQETILEGMLTTKETVRIDGLLKGEIHSEGSVIIGETGRVDGDIYAQSILVAGAVDGNLTIGERMEVTSTGMILGDIVTRILVIEEGGSFKGNCQMETMMSKNQRAAEGAQKERGGAESLEVLSGQGPAKREREAAAEGRGTGSNGKNEKKTAAGGRESGEKDSAVS